MQIKLLLWVRYLVVILMLSVSACGTRDILGGGLTPTRDLTGTWQTAIPVVYYTLNLFGQRAMKVTANITLQLQQNDNTLIGVITVSPTKQEAVGQSPIVDPGGPSTIHNGTVSVTNVSFLAGCGGPMCGTAAERWQFTFTTDLMQGTVSNVDTYTYFGRESDTNAIKLVRK